MMDVIPGWRWFRKSFVAIGRVFDRPVRISVGSKVLLLILLSSYSALGDPQSESSPTAEALPTPKQNAPNIDRAIEAYSDAIEEHPSANAYARRGAAKLAKGDLDGALADAEQALTLDPRCVDALATRATVRQGKGDSDGAIQDLTSLISETPKSYQVWALRGSLRLNKNDLDGALHDYNQVVALAPNLSEALEIRAGIYMRKSAYRDALQDSNRAIEIDPAFSLGFVTRGQCHLRLHELTDAKNDFNKAIELDPIYGGAFEGLGYVALESQDPETALNYFNRAVQLNANPPPYVSRSVAEIALGQYHDAIMDLSEAERLVPKEANSLEVILWVARALNGDMDTANAELKAYLTESQTTDAWGLTKARFLLDEISEDLFLRKMARGPYQLCEAYFYAGIKRLLAGDKTGAADLFDTCTRFDIRAFVEDQLARVKLKEWAEKPGE